MSTLMGNTTSFDGSLTGLKYDQIGQFQDSRSWADPMLKLFFSYAKVESNLYQINVLAEFINRSFALILLVLFSPILLGVMLAIKITMPGKIFYRQIRVGKDGRLFEVLKFRSMIENAEAQTGHTLSWSGDPRITPFGNFLRKSHLDELPQLINVLKGDMYFVGPRPERPEFTKTYEQTIPNYDKRHHVKPGITGLAQIACVYDATAEEKLKYDLIYIAFRNSIVLNLVISYHTAKKMLLMRPTAGVLI
jgi:lipopolysaccharide/colanic/teichoic acid biosynthesis glycosyltransferase